MLNSKLRFALGLLGLVLFASRLPAQLDLHFDTTTKNYWWTGSASVALTVPANTGIAVYIGDGGDLGNDFLAFGNGGGLSFSFTDSTFTNVSVKDGSAYATSSNLLFEAVRINGMASTASGTFNAVASRGSPTVYYGGADANHISYVESLDGQSLYFRNMNGGTKFSDAIGTISVTAGSPIPEPSTYAAFAGAGVLVLAILRRRRQTA